jgi:hypothetical protein
VVRTAAYVAEKESAQQRKKGRRGKILTSLNSASNTYQRWNAVVNTILSVTLPIRSYCHAIMDKSITIQRINPGLISLKHLMSKSPRRGLRERPINHCK